jgi:hypothetical protein
MAPAFPGAQLDSVSSPITKRVYNLGLDEFIEWFGLEPRPGFTKAAVAAWRVARAAPRLGFGCSRSAVPLHAGQSNARRLAREAPLLRA